MSAAEMTERIAETSPRFKARVAGGLWLMVIATGMTAFIIRSPMIVRGVGSLGVRFDFVDI